jgi:hypothetical protein
MKTVSPSCRDLPRYQAAAQAVKKPLVPIEENGVWSIGVPDDVLAWLYLFG